MTGGLTANDSSLCTTTHPSLSSNRRKTSTGRDPFANRALPTSAPPHDTGLASDGVTDRASCGTVSRPARSSSVGVTTT